MEGLLILAGLFLFAVVVGGAIAGVGAWIRVGALQRRIDALERTLREDRTRSPSAARPSAPTAPHPAAPTSAEPPRTPQHVPPFLSDTAKQAAPSAPASDAPPASSAAPAPSQATPTAAPLPPPRTAPASPPRPPAARIDWERWIGVRGAAVLGGIVLAIAGFFLVQYSIERGLVTPTMRVIAGAVAGLTCMIASGRLRARGYTIQANALTGAGAVVLFASAWAAHVLYGLVPFPAAFAAMVAVTVACGLLSYRHSSELIAVLGLSGGFATPIVLSTGQDNPVGLFGYVLLLDMGFLYLAQKRRWPSLGLVALAGTFLLQALWIFARLDAARLWLGLVILGVFALLFAFWTARAGMLVGARGRFTQAASLTLPFLFAVYFAQHAELGRDPWPPVVLSILLTLAAGWMSRGQPAPHLLLGTASGSVALCLTWALSQPRSGPSPYAWDIAGCVLALAAAHHLFVEWTDRNGSRRAALAGVVTVILGGLVVLVLHTLLGQLAPWPPLLAATALGLLAQRAGARGAAPWTLVAASLMTGLVPLAWTMELSRTAFTPLAWTATLAAQSALLLAAARASPGPDRRLAFLGAAACALLAPISLVAGGYLDAAAPAWRLGAPLVLGLLIVLGVTGARAVPLLAVAVAATLLAQNALDALDAPAWTQHDAGLLGFALVALGGALFAAWPSLRGATWEGSSVWRLAAVASLPWAWVLTSNLDTLRGRSASWIGPAAFALLHGALALRAPRALDEARLLVLRAWHGGAALLWLACVPALLADVEPRGGIALALWGAALAWLASRLAHVRLRILATVVVAVATLVISSQVLSWHDRAAWILSPSIAWLCLVPAAAALAAARWLRSEGVQDVHPSLVTGACAVVLVFVGLNLEIAHAWADAPRFRVHLGGLQARDLTTSLAWALYALVLLVVGVRRAASAPRWASLALMLATIGKVFLVDLANLTGLYRVGAIFGLAVSLIAVSLLYQRYVFRPVRSQDS